MSANFSIFNKTAVYTLANLTSELSRLNIAEQSRRNMSSAINTICRVIGRPPHLVPANVPVLRALLADANFGQAGVTATRWRNAKSELNRALALVGVIDIAPTSVKLNPNWEAVVALIPSATQRSAVRRFASFCAGRCIDPSGVSDEVATSYHDHLHDNRLSKTPKRTLTDLVRFWNHIAEWDERGLPTLSVRASSRNYVLPWASLPLGLAAEAAQFREASLSPDWFESDGNRRAVRPATADQRDRMLRRLASAELLSGVSREALNSLADLVRPANLRRGLEFMIKRNGGNPNRQVFEMALLSQNIARHWTALPHSDVDMIRKWVRKFRPTGSGMTEKNRERLRQFNGADIIGRLVRLPGQVFDRIASKRPSPTTARLAQRALMLALLTSAPMRLKNLVSLDRNEHFRAALSIDAKRCHIAFPADQVKNRVELDFPLSPQLMTMIDHYMSLHQPLLAKDPTSVLFPGRKRGTTMSDGGLRNSLMGFVQQELGLTINPHLFRHLCALIFLKTNPGQYESVRQLLGHKSIQTTTEFYAGFESDEAAIRFAGILDSYRAPDR